MLEMNRIPKRTLVFGVLCLLFIFALFLRASTAIIVEDLMADLAVPAASLGLMSAGFFYAYAAAQIPVGMLSDRIGVRFTVFCFGLLGVAGTLLFAFSQSIGMATWARIITGAGTAGIWIPALKYLSTEYRPEEFATLTSIINAIGCLGLLFSTYPMAVMVELIGWRYSFVLPGLILLLFTILAWFLMKPRPEQEIKAGKEITDDPKVHQEAAVTASGIAGKQFWKYSFFWPFAIWAFLVYGVLFSFTGLWGASYLQDSFNISRETAGTHLMFISIGMICGGLFWGILSDRYLRARRPVLLIGTAGMLLTWIALASFTNYPGPILTSLLYFAIGIFSITFLINIGCAKELFPMEIAGTAMGTVNAGMFIGVAVFQGVSGYLLDYFLESRSAFLAFRAIFILYIVSIAIALLMVFLMPESFPGRIKKPASP